MKNEQNNRRGSNTSTWQESVVEIKRVTKVVKGGKKLKFRVIAVVGDGKGLVGIGVGKAAEVVGAIKKAVLDGKKNAVNIPITKNGSVYFPVTARQGAAKVFIGPASLGSGIIAGSSSRSVLDVAGIKNVIAKRLGSKSLLNNARAVVDALHSSSDFVA